MSELWDASATIKDTVEDLLGKHHPEIASASFGYVFKDKASAAELEAGIVAMAKKVPPMYKLLSKDDLDFVIVVAKDMWDELEAAEREAHLDSALCSCSVKLQEDGDFKLDAAGNPIYCLRAFDLQGHSEILQRYGIDTFAEVGQRIKAALGKSSDKGDSDNEEE
jgi:hypothetical protein